MVCGLECVCVCEAGMCVGGFGVGVCVRVACVVRVLECVVRRVCGCGGRLCLSVCEVACVVCVGWSVFVRRACVCVRRAGSEGVGSGRTGRWCVSLSVTGMGRWCVSLRATGMRGVCVFEWV